MHKVDTQTHRHTDGQTDRDPRSAHLGLLSEPKRNLKLDNLYIVLKSADLEIFLFADNLRTSFLILFMSVSYPKVICAQSWGHIEALGTLEV